MFTLSVIPLFSSFSCLCQVARVELHRFLNGPSLVRFQSGAYSGLPVALVAQLVEQQKNSLLDFPLALFW